MWYRLGERSMRRQRVNRSQRAGERKAGKRIIMPCRLGLVHEFVGAPILLEALLRAKVAVLDTKLQAGWALQRTSIILTIRTKALPFGGGF